MKKDYLIPITAGAVILLDQLTKIWASKLTSPIPIISNFFQLRLSTNTGAGFGIFTGFNSILIFISLIILGGIFYYYDQIPKKSYLYICYALIVGGAIGNLIDRIRLGRVIDFIAISIWPSFNIADAAITIGAIIFAIYLYREN
jgi:signal peptidase II